MQTRLRFPLSHFPLPLPLPLPLPFHLDLAPTPPIPLHLQVRAWAEWFYPAADFLDVSIRVTSVAEPPMAQSASFQISAATSGMLVGVLAASDEDVTAGLQFRLIAGDPLGAFAVSPTGRLFVANADAFTSASTYFLTVEVSDGLLRDLITVPVAVTAVNLPPIIRGAVFSIAEGSPVNTVVGTEPDSFGTLLRCWLQHPRPQAHAPHPPPPMRLPRAREVLLVRPCSPPTACRGCTFPAGVATPSLSPRLCVLPADPNPDDSLQFAIVAGNSAGAFKIATCGGQIRVADAVLDFDSGPREYNLTVRATDDGTPSRNATAVFIIRVCARPYRTDCLPRRVWAHGRLLCSSFGCVRAPTELIACRAGCGRPADCCDAWVCVPPAPPSNSA